MTEKLRSHLRNQKGFTLIELLVVIAIIAILVVIVIVAINPIQRLADAADRTASSNVRSTGTLVQTCITQISPNETAGVLYSTSAWAAGPPATGGCAVAAGSTTAAIFQYGTPAASVLVEPNSGATDICVSQQGATNGANPHWYSYRATTVGTPTGGTVDQPGTVTQQNNTMPTTTAARCP